MATDNGKKTRKATEYVVLVQVPPEGIDGAITFYPLLHEDGDDEPQRFEGFRKIDVLSDLINDGRLTPEGDGQYTPNVAIIPASSWDVLRGRIEVKRQLVID